jgi:acyl-CoA synthetase (AMP-forming)/AMP-acid ligase II/thioesterase domain-containing protein/acyl carrier protein
VRTTGPGLGPWRTGGPERFVPFPDKAVDRSVTERLLAIAAEHPDRTAISSPGGTWTYAQLDEQVRRTAAGLLAQVEADQPTPIGLVASHDGPLVAAMLGIIAAGHIVVVLDATVPQSQTAHVLAECAPPVVVHDAAHAGWVADRLAGPGAPRPVDLASLDAEPVELPARAAGSPLMLAFTSGTSGSPKAAVITHGVVLNLVRGATNALGIGPDDRMPMLFPVSMAVAAYPLFLPLLNGGTLATLDVRTEGLEPVGSFLERERITVAYMAPTVVRFLVDALEGRTFPDLRLVALGGEVVDREVLRLTAAVFGPTWVANGYGTTETGVVTLWVVDAADLEGPTGDDETGDDDADDDGTDDASIPVGYPVPDVEITILDDTGDPLPPGEAGEVAVSSPYVFHGYWRHPILSRRVLSPDRRGRAHWQTYRTGDIGRLDEHGALVVSGRLDTRVKVRGRSVVVADVETRVQQLDDVADAAVIPVNQDGVVELTAFVVLRGDAAADVTGLRTALLEHDEPYRVPSRWIVLGQLPRLPNGKLDRRRLALEAEPPGDATDHGRRPSVGVDAPPRRPGPDSGELVTMQFELRDLWSRLLPGRPIGLDDDFVALGGDSLKAAEMVLAIEREHAVVVPMGQLVHANTVRRLAEVLIHLRHTAETDTTIACVNPGDESRPRLWFVHDLHGSAYRIRHLAKELGDDQPIWSFESPLLRGEPNRATSLDTFAARYVTDLRRAQPTGPYWLAGYSFGAVCVYEMARQLLAEGEEIAFLGIVDVGPGYRGPGWHATRSPLRPWLFLPHPPEEGSPMRRRLGHYASMVRLSPRRTARHLMVRSGLVRVIDPMRYRRDLRRFGRVRPTLRLWYAWEEHWKLAARGWNRGGSYPGRMHLFWGSESGSADATMGWAPLVRDLVIVRFDGDHMGILEPRGVTALAEVLRRAIDDEIDASRSGDGGSGVDRGVAVDVDLTAPADLTDDIAPEDDDRLTAARAVAGRTERTR